MNERNIATRYPRLSRRMQAVIIDGIILAGAFFGAAVFMSSTDINAFLKIGFVAFFPMVLEPGLVSVTGATIGHRLRGLRVERADNGENLDFFRATVRFFTKSFLGLPSLVLVLLTKRHQAIHDLATGSVVIFQDPSKVNDHEALPERVMEENEFVYPSKHKRTFFIIIYAFGGLIFEAVVLMALEQLLINRCAAPVNCASIYQAVDDLAVIGWLFFLGVVMALGWSGRLWGCRRIKRDS
ncbi:MAG: RDD family protein [Rhodospirillales bacterium]|nr:RDD family protein [Rhodospirillales bacterium]